jgi:pimeloyl-ACP methyl ester carboxylesterase
MQTHHILGFTEQGFHKVVYHEWGDPEQANALICAHGFTRNSHDFDFLAERFKSHYRVICPDIVGRGESDWLPLSTHYEPLQYIRDMTILLGRINAKTVTWIGTSMGGLIGIILAAMPQTPIKRLILNDVGPFIAKKSMQGLGTALANATEFATLVELEQHLKKIYMGFGPLEERHWQHILKYDHKKNSNGKYRRNYDPAIVQQLHTNQQMELNLWPYWAHVTQPTLVLHGLLSEMLTPGTAQKMQVDKPNVTLIDLPHIGHPASLMIDSEIELVANWLIKHPLNGPTIA